MLILLTPRLRYNPETKEIEWIIEDEEADLEGVGGGTNFVEDY